MSVLRRAFVEVEPSLTGFDVSLRDKLRQQDPGGKAGKLIGRQIGGRLNQELARLDLHAIDVKADPKSALAAIEVTGQRLRALSRDAATVEVKVQTERALGQLARFRKQLGDVGDDSASGFFAKFSQRLGPLVASIPIKGPLGAAVAAAGVSAAPLLGAALSGAVIGGAGGLGIVGGLVLASKDERVAAAISGLGKRLEARLLVAGGVFIQPALQGLRQIDAALRSIDLEGIFQNASRSVPTLTAGITAAIRGISNGVERLVAVSGPALDAVGDAIGTIGETVGKGLISLADNGKSSAEALRTLFAVVDQGVSTTFRLVNVLTEAYEIGQKFHADFVLKAVVRLGALSSANEDAAGTARHAAGATRAQGDSIRMAAEVADVAKVSQQQLAVQVSIGQQAANAHSRAVLGEVGAMKDLNNALRAEVDPLFALINSQNTLKQAQDRASEAVKKHGRNSAEARVATRNLAAAALDLQGRTAALATGFDGRLTPSLRATFKAAGLTKGQIRDVERQLITAKRSADKFDGRYMANVGITGDKSVLNRLANLAAYQNALKQGSSNIASIRKKLSNDNADFLKFDAGGYTGPGGKYQPAGIVHRDEFVIRKESRQKIERRNPGLLNEMNATGQMPGYAAGGHVGWPFPVTAAKTRVPSVAEVAAKVAVSFGAWPSSPGAQRGDSGVWRKIVALIRSTGPMSGHFGNAYRAGDPLWHGSGRAVDWMGYNQDRLASFLAAKRPLELIHRTKNRDYAYTRGVNKGSFNNSLMEAHRNHVHIAMDNGGYLMPGWNPPIYNGTGRAEPVTPGADMDKVVALLSSILDATRGVAPGVGDHVKRAVGGVNASLGTAANLYSRGAW